MQRWLRHGGPSDGYPGVTATGDWSMVVRDNGDQQWAYKGRPLYFWAKDAKPGDRTGDGLLNNSWHIAKP